MELAQTIAIQLLNTIKISADLSEGRAALKAQQLIVDPELRKTKTQVGLVAVRAAGGDKEGRVGPVARHIGIALPDVVISVLLAIGPGQI